MPAALLLVNDPILHPIAARAGDLLAWYPAVGINALRQVRGTWHVMRSLPFDNAGALAGLLADGAITPYAEQDAVQALPLIRAAQRLTRPSQTSGSPASHGCPSEPVRSA